jgi:hypothetical protein
VAIAHGLNNAKKIMELIKSGKPIILSLKSCAVPVAVSEEGVNLRHNQRGAGPKIAALYQVDESLPIRKSTKTRLFRNFTGIF